eukprot:TRINITY_DN8156_c0_g1_i2.p1 TRINITY_DN8156_c0_g1~~TRINITY_DN8156_c0_g1_i2.p1  ORF type:complete len:232 (-),score=42.62 TRINITY_DN8156_c0_g1_i2:239-934(-)
MLSCKLNAPMNRVANRASFKCQALFNKKPAPAPKSQKVKVQSTRSNPFKLGFTKDNELFVGRIAMIGFASSLIGEVLTGKGAVSQFGYETGLGLGQVDLFLGFLIAFNLVAAILPTAQTFAPEEQEAIADRKSGSLQDPRINISNPQKFFGITSFGFSKENELFVGRVAQLGFAFSIIGELLTGKGPLAQFDFETGIDLKDTEYGLIAFIGFFLLAAINPGSGKFVDDEEA